MTTEVTLIVVLAEAGSDTLNLTETMFTASQIAGSLMALWCAACFLLLLVKYVFDRNIRLIPLLSGIFLFGD